MTNEPLLKVEGLIKRYDGRAVVDELDFHVGYGEIVGLRGRNGAGKTTTFRMTVGMIEPEGGRVVFEGRGVTLLRNGDRAIELFVQRSLSADVLEVADKVEAYLEEIRPTLPANLTIEAYDVAADLIRGRIDLLLRNGVGGLFLVVAILFIFLNARVAFWVAAGIPISLLATMGVMLASGQTINMVSLFGLIMAIGIVVDDAIVVGEHVATRYREGLSGTDAAAAGGKLVAS